MSIWTYKNLLEPKVSKSFQLTLGEGETPCQQCKILAKAINLEKLYIKREDLNPTGSFKDRSLAFQLSVHNSNNDTDLVISSTGNAAISAISYSQKFKCDLTVFVSKYIAKNKLDRLIQKAKIKNFKRSLLEGDDNIVEFSNKNIKISFSVRPKSDSIKYAKNTRSIHLRGSNDDLAIIGYKTLSYELAKQAKDCDSIFIPCSSGTSAIGIYQGYLDIDLTPPRIHIVQTTKIHPMAKEFDKEFKKTSTSLASAISDRVSHRKNQVIEAVSQTGGSGWVISDKELNNANKVLLDNCDIKTSYDSLLSLAGLLKALSKGGKIKKPVIILSGK